MKRLAMVALVSLCALPAAQGQQRNQPVRPAPASQPAVPPAPPAEPPPAPYEAQIMKLAEILGGLAYMTELCRPDGQRPDPNAEGAVWRKRMRELIDAEAQTTGQKERYAGAFNRGFIGYQTTYRTCTPAGKAVVEGLLKDGAKTAQDISNRFGS